MRASLSDRADLRRLRPLAAEGPAAAIAACLIDASVVQLDPDDASWPDRDRLVAVNGELAAAVGARLAAAGLPADIPTTLTPGDALGNAVGAALLSARQGAAWRVWCLLEPGADDDGVVWEAARAATAAWPLPLVVVAAGSSNGLWEAAGWVAHQVPDADPLHVLAALDRAVAAPARPTVVTVGS